MKKLLLLIVLGLINVIGYAQKVNNKVEDNFDIFSLYMTKLQSELSMYNLAVLFTQEGEEDRQKTGKSSIYNYKITKTDTANIYNDNDIIVIHHFNYEDLVYKITVGYRSLADVNVYTNLLEENGFVRLLGYNNTWYNQTSDIYVTKTRPNTLVISQYIILEKPIVKTKRK